MRSSGNCALPFDLWRTLCSIIAAEVTKVTPNKRQDGGNRLNSLEWGSSWFSTISGTVLGIQVFMWPRDTNLVNLNWQVNKERLQMDNFYSQANFLTGFPNQLALTSRPEGARKCRRVDFQYCGKEYRRWKSIN